jgi:hypothetical protein
MRNDPNISEVLQLLRTEMKQLSESHRRVLTLALVEPKKLSIENSPGEFVVAVATFNGKLLYWSDIEEGWELETPNSNGCIPTRGTSQFSLEHVLNQQSGSRGRG